MMYFEAKGISVRYDKVSALRDVSIRLDQGGVMALIGANGAGKTTTLRAITGLKRPSQGEIWFEGQRIDQLPPAKIVARGIAMVPEGRHVYPYMSVKDNLLMGAYLRSDKDGIRSDLERIFTRFPRVKERMSQQAGTLSGGEQEMVVVGRALMARPRLLLARPRPHGRARDRPPDRRREPRGEGQRHPGRAELADGAQSLAICLRAGDRSDRPGRPLAGAHAQRPYQEALPGRLSLMTNHGRTQL
jgi:ABC-type uncharacterized transport system ATPase subunit